MSSKIEDVKFTVSVVRNECQELRNVPVREVLGYTTDQDAKEIGGGGEPIYGNIIDYKEKMVTIPEMVVKTYEQIPMVHNGISFSVLKNPENNEYITIGTINSIGEYFPSVCSLKYGFEYKMDGKTHVCNQFMSEEDRNEYCLKTTGCNFSQVDYSYKLGETTKIEKPVQKLK